MLVETHLSQLNGKSHGKQSAYGSAYGSKLRYLPQELIVVNGLYRQVSGVESSSEYIH